MTTAMLQVVAGAEARQKILKDGFEPRFFDKFMAASGGPKWLPIAQLDRHLMANFFSSSQTLSLLGTSSGSWRCSCLSHPNHQIVHKRLEQAYIDQTYEGRPSPEVISQTCRALLDDVLGDQGAAKICNNPYRKLNIITCRGRHLNAMPTRLAQWAGLISTALFNTCSRRTLQLFWQRWLFHGGGQSDFLPLSDLPTSRGQITPNNLRDLLLASGSIPLVLAGVKNLAGAQLGRYYDGGITDYHLDLPSLKTGKLTLYPHFYSYALPGWFDKKLPWRRAKKNFSKVVMIAPSKHFIARLPSGRLPDRHDFHRYDDQQRIEQWNQIVALGGQLVSEFETMRSDPSAYLG